MALNLVSGKKSFKDSQQGNDMTGAFLEQGCNNWTDNTVIRDYRWTNFRTSGSRVQAQKGANHTAEPSALRRGKSNEELNTVSKFHVSNLTPLTED